MQIAISQVLGSFTTVPIGADNRVVFSMTRAIFSGMDPVV